MKIKNLLLALTLLVFSGCYDIEPKPSTEYVSSTNYNQELNVTFNMDENRTIHIQEEDFNKVLGKLKYFKKEAKKKDVLLKYRRR